MRRNFWRELVNIAALGGGVQKHIFDEDGNFVLLLRYGSDGEPFFGAGERDVKEAPFFLNVKLFGGLGFLHERCGISSHSRSSERISRAVRRFRVLRCAVRNSSSSALAACEASNGSWPCGSWSRS